MSHPRQAHEASREGSAHSLLPFIQVMYCTISLEWQHTMNEKKNYLQALIITTK
jgi:hypothetical protein